MREEILKAQELEVRELDVPKWGRVRVTELTSEERVDFFKMCKTIEKEDDAKTGNAWMAALVVRALVDSEGARLFSDDEWPILARKNGAALKAVYDVVAEINGIGQAQEDLLGESEPSPS